MSSDRNLARIAAVKDVLHFFHLPGGESLGVIAEERLRKKEREAFEAVLEGFREGGDSQITVEGAELPELVDMMLRLSDAVSKGTAKENLHLLAKVIVGLKKNKQFQFDKFQKWANVLETLTREEILVLGKAYSVMLRPVHAWSIIKDELIPSTFSTNAQLEAVCAQLLRTGLLLPIPALGSVNYQPSEALRELGELALLKTSL